MIVRHTHTYIRAKGGWEEEVFVEAVDMSRCRVYLLGLAFFFFFFLLLHVSLFGVYWISFLAGYFLGLSR